LRTPTNIADADWIDRLIRVLEEFRQVHQDITANQIVTFLHVALRPDVTQRELAEATGLNDGTISRIVAILSDRGLGERKGADVITIAFKPGDYRMRVQNLSSSGARLLQRIRDIVVS
jgi:DNA-binding MarR family transcriptional regulator